MATWFRTHPVAVSIELDGEPWYDDHAMTVLVLNVGQRGSESLHLVPDAQIDDGRLHVVVLRRHSVAGLIRFAAAIVRRRPPPRRDAATGRAAEVVVTWARPVSLQCDGDAREPAATTTYEVEPGALRFMDLGG